MGSRSIEGLEQFEGRQTVEGVQIKSNYQLILRLEGHEDPLIHDLSGIGQDSAKESLDWITVGSVIYIQILPGEWFYIGPKAFAA